MRWVGPIIGMPFSLEGFAFFAEAVFLGLYMYGWHRVSPCVQLAVGVLVALSGTAFAVSVVIANSWMNTPVGFKIVHGKLVEIDPLAALTNLERGRHTQLPARAIEPQKEATMEIVLQDSSLYECRYPR